MVGLDIIHATLQNGVKAINDLSQALAAVFPQATTVSTSATVGAITFSSSLAVGFLTVQTSSGASYKVPLYNT